MKNLRRIENPNFQFTGPETRGRVFPETPGRPPTNLPTFGCEHHPGFVPETFHQRQRLPPGLSLFVSETADFITVLSNADSNRLLDEVLDVSKSHAPELRILGLKLYFGIERRVGLFCRSDHAPFWAAEIPAFMWTDTAEFRNPNYHLPADMPETLDYEFLNRVTRAALASVLRT